ncbi:hypothetical protein PRZ48_012984 [Zasmidium cellare]|uniref:ABC transporter n=1 Tax=Zasmidium cellare TaxID=395010 RepID=A0ABR0E3D2_ZASCE|nr:hypothetical protein PRZ48_012984 [Zasmidium cellare]
MMNTTQTSTALVALHLATPLAIIVYFIAAKITASCLLQQPSKSSGRRWRRYPAIALALAVTATVVAEGITTITQAFQQAQFSPGPDYSSYLLLLLATHSGLSLGLIENSTPIWHQYLGAWFVALALEVPIIALQGLTVPTNEYAESRMIFCVLRALCLLVLCLFTGFSILGDRRRSVKLDDESEALLAADANEASTNGTNGQPNGHTSKPARSPNDSLFSSAEDSDDENYDWGYDSDTEDPEGDKELRAQQKKRLQESGSWISYLSEYGIFVRMVVPRKAPRVQACIVLVGICIVAERILNILVPRQLGILVEDLTNFAGTGQVPWSSLGFWILYAALGSHAGVRLIREIAQLPVQQYGYKAIATISFEHVMTLSMDFHNEKNSGELMRAIEQGTNLQDLVNFMFFDVLPMFFDLVAAFVYVSILFDVYMAMILLAVGVAYIWIGAKVTSLSIKQRRNFNTTMREESKVQNEAINNWQTVSHFNRGKYESARYSNAVDAFNFAEWRYYLAFDLGGGAQNAVMFLGRVAVTVLAVYQVTQGTVAVRNFVTLVSYLDSIEEPFSLVSYSVRKITGMLTDSERLLQLLTTKPSITDAPDAKELVVTKGEVSFDHVDFAYDPRRPTLKNVDFTVKPGQTVALVGETGGGKSTTLKLLYRYYDVSAGAIRIDGQDIRGVTLDSLRDSFGMVPQDPSLFNFTIMENIKYARLDATDEEVMDACRAAAIHDKIMSFPDGYSAKVGERGVKLSGGELQRIAIARAMVRRPKIVLLDEATSMIDAETEAIIQQAFKRLTADRTTFIVAHRLSTIQHADLILVINNGEIVERGTHEELFEKNGKYVALWSKQLSKDVASRQQQALIEVEDEQSDSTLSSGEE